jgi:hypothetical protein
MSRLARLVLLGWFAVPQLALAHKPSDSYLMLTQPSSGTQIEGQWDIALRDLHHAIGLDSNDDGLITWGEIKAHAGPIQAYALSRLQIEGLARGEREACSVTARSLLVDAHVDGGYVVLPFAARCPFRPAQLALHYGLLFDLDPNHRGLLEIRAGGGSQAFVLSASAPVITLNLDSPDLGQQFLAFVKEGVWHIWKGYDHILFLLTLLLPAVVLYRDRQWRARESLEEALLDVLKIVTAFTAAHSLTLALAVNGWVQLPARIVESAIALTVILGALNNLLPVVRERRWVVAFLFGLVHGLGFAAVLSDLGLHGWTLAVALIGFNVGVEAGQLAVVVGFVPLAYAVRRTRFYRCALMPGGSGLIGVLALYWLAIRATGTALQ